MTSNNTSIELHPVIAPGDYDGLYSAYYVVILFSNKRQSAPIKMLGGVRGINCKCRVNVDDNGLVTEI